MNLFVICIFLLAVSCTTTRTNNFTSLQSSDWRLVHEDSTEKKYEIMNTDQSLTVKTFPAADRTEALSIIRSRLFAWKTKSDRSRDPYFHKVDEQCSEKIWKVLEPQFDGKIVQATFLTEANSEKALETCFKTDFWLTTEWIYCEKEKSVLQFNAFFPKKLWPSPPPSPFFACN